MTLSYDKKADVLYVAFEPAVPGTYIYVENENGDILKLDRNTKQVVGCTIPFFATRAAGGPVVVPEVGPVPFNEVAEEILRS